MSEPPPPLPKMGNVIYGQPPGNIIILAYYGQFPPCQNNAQKQESRLQITISVSRIVKNTIGEHSCFYKSAFLLWIESGKGTLTLCKAIAFAETIHQKHDIKKG